MWKDNLQSGFDCTQFYQYSTDGGTQWSETSTTFNELVGCPEGISLFGGPDNSVIIMADLQDETYIQAWNWETWSDPQIQSDVNQFTDPITFSDVRLGAKRTAMGANNKLYVTGSDTVGNQDIWAISRDIGDINAWYPPPNAWSKPTLLTETTGDLHDPVILSDSSGLFHLFWTQSVDPDNPQHEWRVFYSQYDGMEWLEPVALKASPDKDATNVSATFDESGKIYITWQGAKTGDIYFAWAESDKAYSVFEWSDPLIIPRPPNSAVDPEIYSGLNEILYITYAIPINEGRGIYLTESSNQGATWSAPKLVFDGVAAGWSAVGKAQLSQTQDANLQILISQKNFPNDNFAIALHYMSSSDNGNTWSAPTLVIDQPVVESHILAADQLTIHRYWQTDIGLDSRLWHEVSLDSGLTWITSAPISVLGIPGPSDMALDEQNRLHLVQRYSESEGAQFLQHWEWRGNSWESMDNLNMGDPISGSASSLTVVANPQGRLTAVSLEQQSDPNTGTLTNYLMSTSRLLDDQAPQVTPVAPPSGQTETLPQDTPIVPLETQQNIPPAGSTDIPATPTPIMFQGNDVIVPPASSVVYLIVGVGAAVVAMVLLLVYMRFRGK